MIEQASSGQIGQPAACMIENKWIPPSPMDCKCARDYPTVAGLRTSARVFHVGDDVTATVDNFVDNPLRKFVRTRARWAFP